jgi:hypothetical protein
VRGSAPVRGLTGFDRAAFGGTQKVSGRKASRHIEPTPPARSNKRHLFGNELQGVGRPRGAARRGNVALVPPSCASVTWRSRFHLQEDRSANAEEDEKHDLRWN